MTQNAAGRGRKAGKFNLKTNDSEKWGSALSLTLNTRLRIVMNVV